MRHPGSAIDGSSVERTPAGSRGHGGRGSTAGATAGSRAKPPIRSSSCRTRSVMIILPGANRRPGRISLMQNGRYSMLAIVVKRGECAAEIALAAALPHTIRPSAFGSRLSLSLSQTVVLRSASNLAHRARLPRPPRPRTPLCRSAMVSGRGRDRKRSNVATSSIPARALRRTSGPSGGERNGRMRRVAGTRHSPDGAGRRGVGCARLAAWKMVPHHAFATRGRWRGCPGNAVCTDAFSRCGGCCHAGGAFPQELAVRKQPHHCHS